MFRVPAAAHNEIVSKVVQKFVVIVNLNSVTRRTAHCGYVEGPRQCFNLNNCSLYFVCLVSGLFIVLQGCTDDYFRTTMGGAIWVVTMLYGVVGYFNHSSIGKVGFCYNQYINVGIVKKLDYFRLMIKQPICVPLGNTKGFNGQC